MASGYLTGRSCGASPDPGAMHERLQYLLAGKPVMPGSQPVRSPGGWPLADGSPGGFGDREIWIDEAALDMIARGDFRPAIVLRPGDDQTLIGAGVRVDRHPVPVTYTIISRRWSQANAGRPYYVLAWPGLVLLTTC